MRVLLLSDDLLLPSRVKEALRPLAWSLTVASSGIETALAAAPDLVIVNLAARRFDPLDAVRAAKAAGRKTLAFAGHVEAEKHAAARDAGADLVAANSSIALHLPALLKQLGFDLP